MLLCRSRYGPLGAAGGGVTAVASGAGADEAGLEVITPREPGQRGSHVTLRHPEALPVMAALIEAGVIGDVRPPDLLRFGFNALYNSFGELTRALEILGEVLSSGRYREPRFQARPTVT